ncbi:Ribosome-associated, YjgA [Dillenia turbinata]|uniref:Ribosome-associated, YjgA n=1 Tax=Dillenia turbinata TaxID=194707 RepID=A0AAN8W025_9MAGN
MSQRLGPDVREGKRRQFNYIGRLLRDAEPELMDALIQALKDGDQSKLQSLSSSRASDFDDYDGNESEDAEDDDEEEVSQEQIEIAARWFDGLVNRDSGITNEVYSVHSIEFDRQELRKLVRKVQLLQDEPAEMEDELDEESAALVGSKKALTRFLHSLAMQLATE